MEVTGKLGKVDPTPGDPNLAGPNLRSVSWFRLLC
jgi:hypothetical protein